MSTHYHRYGAYLVSFFCVFILFFTINGCSSPNNPNLSSSTSHPPSNNGTSPNITGTWVGTASWDATRGDVQATISNTWETADPYDYSSGDQIVGSFTGSWVWDDRVQQTTESFHGTITNSGKLEIDETSGGVIIGIYAATLSNPLSSTGDTISGYWTMDQMHTKAFLLVKQ